MSDIVDGVLRLVDHPDAIGDVFNVGAQGEISMTELARKIIEKTGSTSTIEFIPYEKAYEAGFEDMERRVPDTTKLNALTGWLPTRSLDDILDETIAEMKVSHRA